MKAYISIAAAVLSLMALGSEAKADLDLIGSTTSGKSISMTTSVGTFTTIGQTTGNEDQGGLDGAIGDNLAMDAESLESSATPMTEADELQRGIWWSAADPLNGIETFSTETAAASLSLEVANTLQNRHPSLEADHQGVMAGKLVIPPYRPFHTIMMTSVGLICLATMSLFQRWRLDLLARPSMVHPAGIFSRVFRFGPQTGLLDLFGMRTGSTAKLGLQ